MLARGRTKGVALLVAVVVVAIITVIATQVSTYTILDESRVAAMVSTDQAMQVALGAEGLAQETLKEIAINDPNKTNLAQGWASPVSLPYTGGQIDVQVEDLQGRLNLNNVINTDGSANLLAIQQLKRLFVMLDVDPALVDKWVDWVDADGLPFGSNGAEDSVYLSLTPSLRPANRPVTSISALRYLPGMTGEQYERLRPYLSALPVGTKLNVCTAKAPVLAVLADGFVEFSQDADQLNRQRATGCFPKIADVQPLLAQVLRDQDALNRTVSQLAENSNYFLVQSTISQSTFSLNTYSVLQVNGNGSGGIIRRSVGWE